jgi:hypothetical protein
MIYNVSMALVIKRLLGLLAIIVVLVFWMGCLSPEDKTDDDDDDGDDITKDAITVYSYNLDEMYQGIFNSPSHAITLNDWYRQARFWENRSFDQWSQSEGKYLYKEKELQTRFTGSDMVNENTVVYGDFADFHWAGEKIGAVTGSITLTDIFDPAPKVWIRRYKEGEPWWFVGKITMNAVTDTQATLDWSIPTYTSYFTPPVENRFALFVLPYRSNYGLEVSIPTPKTIDSADTDVGSLGMVSIKGVTVLSGTITITNNGQPVPYVGIFANYDVHGTIQDTYLSSPGPNAPWSMILGPSSNSEREIEFHIWCFSKENGTASDMLLDKSSGVKVTIIGQDDISDIVLDLGDIADN